MPLMSEFLSYCSVRLGSISTCALSILQTVLILGITFLYEPQENDMVKQNENAHNENVNEEFFDSLYNSMMKNFESFKQWIIIWSAIHTLSSLIGIYGAFKLYKWFLVPYVFLEIVRIGAIFFCHVMSMILLKKKFDLGELIIASVAGGFGILFLLYMWACVFSLFQILQIIETHRYQKLYGQYSLTDNFDNEIIDVKPKGQSAQVIDANFNEPFSSIRPSVPLQPSINNQMFIRVGNDKGTIIIPNLISRKVEVPNTKIGDRRFLAPRYDDYQRNYGQRFY